MFSKEITGLTLANEIASSLFRNINGTKYRNDESFVATLRALLYSRVPKEESIILKRTSTSHRAGSLHGVSPKECVRAFLRESSTDILYGYESGVLLIHSFDGSDDDNTACFAMLDEGMSKAAKESGDYRPMADLAAWIEQEAKFRSRIYMSEKFHNIIIFVEKLNMKRWHLLESLIPRYFPWYFKSSPLADEEKKLLATLTTRYAPKYEEMIQEFAKRFDFRTQVIRNKLTGFETHFDRRKLENVRTQIEHTNNQIRNLEQQFSTCYQQINDLRTQEYGLLYKIEHGGGEESSELLEYFLCNKSLQLMNVRNGLIEFVVTTTVANFDPDSAEAVIRNKRSHFYEYIENTRINPDQAERLLTEIFLKETMKIRVCAAYKLNFDTGSYEAVAGYNFPQDILMDHTPNQHIQAFHCLGGNEATIRASMRARDYVGAVAACVQSAKSVNVLEGATSGRMAQEMFSNGVGRVIEMPDGSTKTPADAIKWLEEQDVEAKKKKEQEESHE